MKIKATILVIVCICFLCNLADAALKGASALRPMATRSSSASSDVKTTPLGTKIASAPGGTYIKAGADVTALNITFSPNSPTVAVEEFVFRDSYHVSENLPGSLIFEIVIGSRFHSYLYRSGVDERFRLSDEHELVFYIRETCFAPPVVGRFLNKYNYGNWPLSKLLRFIKLLEKRAPNSVVGASYKDGVYLITAEDRAINRRLWQIKFSWWQNDFYEYIDIDFRKTPGRDWERLRLRSNTTDRILTPIVNRMITASERTISASAVRRAIIQAGFMSAA